MKKNSLVTLLLLLIFTFSLSSVCLGASTISAISVPGLDSSLITAPSKLTATAVSSSEIRLAWQDNSSGVSRFQLERKTDRGTFVNIATITEGITTYTDTGLSAGTTYYYRVRAYSRANQSAYSNEASAKTTLVLTRVDPLIPKPPVKTVPAAPSEMKADAVSANQITLSWKDNSSNESGFKVERKVGSGSYTLIADVGANLATVADIDGITPGTTYYYRVKAFNSVGESQYSNEASATPQLGETVVIEYVLGSTEYKVNGVAKTMDVAPEINEGRVYLPLRYVVEPLGAVMDWDAAEQKVTIVLGSKTVELWVDQNTATVNGTQVMIDPNNPNVTPIMVPPGRVMVPVRFVAQGLGCTVTWDQTLQKATVEYTPQ